MLKVNGNAKVTKLKINPNFVGATIYTSRKVKEEWKTSFFDTVFVGKDSCDKAKTLGDKAKIKVEEFGVTNEPYEKKTGEKVWNNPKNVIYKFEILDNPNGGNSTDFPVDEYDGDLPF